MLRTAAASGDHICHYEVFPSNTVFRDDKCRAIGLPTGVGLKARRFRLLLDAYGIEPDASIIAGGIGRARHMLEQQRAFAARGSRWEIELTRHCVIDEAALECACCSGFGAGDRCPSGL